MLPVEDDRFAGVDFSRVGAGKHNYNESHGYSIRLFPELQKEPYQTRINSLRKNKLSAIGVQEDTERIFGRMGIGNVGDVLGREAADLAKAPQVKMRHALDLGVHLQEAVKMPVDQYDRFKFAEDLVKAVKEAHPKREPQTADEFLEAQRKLFEEHRQDQADRVKHQKPTEFFSPSRN